MQRLIAHPDERVRSSDLLRDTEELATSGIGKVTSGALHRILMFVLMLVFSSAVILVSIGGGKEVWRDKTGRGIAQFIGTISSELGLVVKTVTILGNNTVASEVFLDSLRVSVGDPMVLTDLSGALARLSGLEWVDTVEVSRRWPSEIIVAVTERKPVALWESSDGKVLIDKDGYSFGTSYIDNFLNLPLIKGVAAPEAFPKLLRFLEINSLVKSSVAGATLIGARRWDLQMKGNLLVRLPEVDLESAWPKFVKHFEENYLLLVGAVVADYTLGDRLILELGTNSARENLDGLARHRTLEKITEVKSDKKAHGLKMARPG